LVAVAHRETKEKKRKHENMKTGRKTKDGCSGLAVGDQKQLDL
jgi:hypothetical protein